MSRLREVRARDGESGFTLVEVAVAGALMAIGLLGLLSVLDTSRDLVSSSERWEAALHRAELELERTRALGYQFVALPAAPASSSDPNDPLFHVQSGPPPGYRWDHSSSTAPYDPLVVDSTACAGSPTPCLEEQTTFQDGRLTGTVHRFVTWVDDPDLAGTTDMKRVTIAVTIDQGPSQRPAVLSTIVRNG